MYLALILILLSITLVLFLKTPISSAEKKEILTLEEKIKSYPKEAKATIIEGNKKQSIINFIPFVLLLLPSVALILYDDYILDTPMICETLFGINLGIAFYIIAFATMNILVFAFSLQLAWQGHKIFKHGYSPPLDTIRFQSLIATKPRFYKAIGLWQMMLPILALILNIYAYQVLNNIYDDDFKNRLNENIEKECHKQPKGNTLALSIYK